MKQVEFYRWRIPQKPPKKPYLTRYFMTLEDGRARHPDGEPALDWVEIREVCETHEETSKVMLADAKLVFPPKDF